MPGDRTAHLSTSEVARLLRVSRQTLYNWMNEGKIPEPDRNEMNGYLLWTAEDVEQIRLIITEARLK